ncbi:MAG: hypothetical protein ABTQ29_00835, partial [Siculibacillus sp.]
SPVRRAKDFVASGTAAVVEWGYKGAPETRQHLFRKILLGGAQFFKFLKNRMKTTACDCG